MRVGAVERNAKAQGKIPFQIGRVVANEMGAILVLNAGLDPFEQPRPFEKLKTKWSRRIVVGREEGEAPIAWLRITLGKRSR